MRAPRHGVHRTQTHHGSPGRPVPPGVIRSRDVIRDGKPEDHDPPKGKQDADEEDRDYQDTMAGAGTLGAGLAAGALLL